MERVAAGQASATDRATLERWIGNDPARRELVRSVARVVQGTLALGQSAAKFDAAASLAQARARLGFTGEAAGRGSRQRSHTGQSARQRAHTFVTGVLAVAAVVVIALVVRTPTVSNPTWRAFVTSRGQRETVTLPDGTRFSLGPESRLRVPDDFGVRTRGVDLEGEGYFLVVHNARLPFAVRAGNAVVTDVGTVFDVRAYAGDGGVRIAVAEGSVDVRAATKAGHDRPVLAGEIATVIDTAVAVLRGADIAAVTAWTQGRLVFNATPLRDVVQDLGRAFDVDITVADSTLLTRRITAAFGVEESLDDVLTAVTLPIDARFDRHGRRIVIERRGLDIKGPGSGAAQPVHLASGADAAE
jgi:transmembrane sensor